MRDRKLTLEFMLANHSPNCATCDVSGECELQDLAYEYQVDAPAWGSKGTRYKVDSDPNPFIRVDMNKCILCRRCVEACAEIQVRDVWGVAKRGFEEVIVAGAGTTMLEARCESCGQCVAYCPTGALSNKMSYGQGIARANQISKVTTTCAYCGVGCQFDLIIKHKKIIGVSSNPDAPVNGMALCVKGRYGYDFVHHPDRLKKPRVRRYLLEKKAKRLKGNAWDWIETDWDTALDITARKLRETREDARPRQHRRADFGKMPERRKLPDEQTGAAGHRDEQHRPLRPSLTLQHGGRSGRLLRFGRDVQLNGRHLTKSSSLLRDWLQHHRAASRLRDHAAPGGTLPRRKTDRG